ncbi:hypothetical protein RZS08_07845, partial [Arthrospira platensis SPKY1]|nr:hypothetical protein [Arthrospira platensis SPKY1]
RSGEMKTRPAISGWVGSVRSGNRNWSQARAGSSPAILTNLFMGYYCSGAVPLPPLFFTPQKT